MKIIDRISSFFNKTERQRRRLQKIAEVLGPILSYGWTKLELVTNKNNPQRLGLQTECYSKMKLGDVLIRIILEPTTKKNKWLLRGRKNLLVHLLFFPEILLPLNEKEAVNNGLSRNHGLSYPEDWFDLKPKEAGYYALDSLLSKIQVTLEASVFLAILPGKVREVCEAFEESTGIKLPTYH